MSRQGYPETDDHLPPPEPSETMRVERRHASGELDLRDAQERLLIADRLAGIGTLAAGAAHEINNPLTYALLNVDHALRQMRIAASEGTVLPMGEDEDVLPAMIRALELAQDGMERVRSISRNLLTFSRGALDTRSLVDVRAIVESSIQMTMHEIVQRAHVVREFGAVPPVEANEAALGQVFINLLVNAAQAIPEGSAPPRHTVRVATSTSAEGDAVVEIEDTGAGIPPELLPRIFDPFFTSKAAGTAMGLGLSISHGTVTHLGGTIDVRSTVGVGTSFRVVLPPAKRWRPASAGRLRAATDAPERRRVLVIDDDRQVGEAIARVLRDEAEVELVTEGRVAVDRFASGERWDVVLCDLMMPDCSGVDVYAGTLERAPDAVGSLVFMTAGAFTPRTRAFLENVSRPCLEKPLEAERIREIVRRGGVPSDRPSVSP
jgi:signal transduction histidine kinase/CheY-like chemotaxis protein